MRILTRSAFLGSLALFLAACTPQPNLKVPDEYKPGQKAFHRVCSNCHGS
ncbi:MAG: cytochrome c, partial [Nitrospinaceae bacterium]|nr:cytochrome c [Nitrospinaceae bacterium]NIR54717.1 cytochrome c [Nitrospinaceae bacterium]NIS85137.1 cytochrome c [Nitrospinaceae bacterium]NIT81954.1 cytochrome c [Nitrospinaceae bacterium]NIU44216.1 cytochrome c [Nitrospinaceae bacterium]